MKEINFDNPMKRHLAEITGYMSDEAIDIKAKLDKPLVKIFVSYAHQDKKKKKLFIERLEERLSTSKENYKFIFSSDTDLLVGEKWHDEIQNKMASSDLGLFLLSTSFLASEYIVEHELPVLLGKCLPVAFDVLDLQRQNLKGLDTSEIFFFDEHKEKKSFREIAGKNQTVFIGKLSDQIEERIKKQFGKEPEGPMKMLSDQLLKYREAKYQDEIFITGDATTTTINRNQYESISGNTVSALGYLKSWALDSEVPFFALLGDFGTGKTFTCRMLAKEIIRLHKLDPERYPDCIYIDLRMVSTRVGTEKKVPKLTDILQEAIDSKDPMERSLWTPKEIIQKVRDNKALIIYDGLDEKSVHFTREETNRFIAELWSIREIRDKQNDAPQGKLLISCRTHYFRNISDQNSLFLGSDREGRSPQEYLSCTLLPFDDNQIREYLQKRLGCDEEEIERIIDLFEKVHNLKELAGRPYALNLITEFIPDLERLQQEGKAINTARLYELTIENWLSRDEGKHEFSVTHKKRLMKALAGEIQRRNGESMRAEELEEWLDNWLYNHPVIKDAYSNMNRETLKKDLRTATFIIREQEREFSFAHTSLQEYFLAGYLLDELSVTDIENVALAITLPSNETMNFAGEMLALDDRLLNTVVRSIEHILEKSYQKGGSELALALWLKLKERKMKQPNPRTVNLEKADLAEWKICNINLTSSHFDNATLRGASFDKTLLSSATFRSASLLNAEFLSCKAVGTDFSGAEAAGSTWRNSDIQNTKWQTTNLRLASFIKCKAAGSKNLTANSDTSSALCAGIANTPLPDGFIINSFTGHSDKVNSCAISSDNNYIVSGSWDKSLKIWDFKSGKCIMSLSGHSEGISSCAISNDTKYILSGSFDKTLKVWDFESGSCIQTLVGHSQGINSCAISQDNRYILSGSFDKTLKVWDLKTGSCIKKLCGHSENVKFCSFSHDNRYILSASHDKSLKVWDFETGSCIRTLSGHSEAVSSCSLSSDNQFIVSGSYDKTLKVWDFESGDCIQTLMGHSQGINSCTLSHDSVFIVSGSSYDSTIKVWNFQTGDCIITLTGHLGQVSSCSLSSDNKYIVSGSYDRSIKVWDFKTGNCIMTITGYLGQVSSCGLSRDNKYIVSGSYDSTLKVWDFNTGSCIKTLIGHLNLVISCAVSYDNNRIVSGSYKELKVWDFKSGSCIMTLTGHSDWVRACALSNDNNYIVSGSYDRSIKVWDFKSGSCIMTLTGHSGHVSSCSFSHDNKYIISGSYDKTLKVWDFKSGNCLLTLAGHEEGINSCALSQDNRYILSGSYDTTLKVWDLKTGNCLMTLSGHSHQVSSCSFSHDNMYIISGSFDKSIKVWDFKLGNCIMTLTGHSGWITSCAISKDNKFIISGSDDNTLKVWDFNSGKCIMTMANLPNNETAAWDGSAQKLLSASTDAWRWIGLSSGIRRLPIELLESP